MGLEKLLTKKRLIVVCGLGGVGKTTLSAALGLKAAQLGKRSLVITVDPAKRLADALGLPIPCPEPKQIWKGKGTLSACLLDAKHTFDHLIKNYAPKNLRETILDNTLYQQLSLMLAGTQEYMAMEKLYDLSSKDKFDIVIVDTPPARHAIDFLKAPMKLNNMLNDSLLKFFLSPSLKMGALGTRMLGALGNLTGGGILQDIANLMNISISLLDGFTQRSQAIQELLMGKKCAFLLATAVNTLTMSDALHFRQELFNLGFSLEGLLINRMPPSYGDPKEVEAAIRWAKKQEAPIWKTAWHLLEQQQTVRSRVSQKLKTLLETLPHTALIPEMPDGVAVFDDLKNVADYL